MHIYSRVIVSAAFVWVCACGDSGDTGSGGGPATTTGAATTTGSGGSAGTGTSCGDGVLDAGEECDVAILGGETCVTQDFDDGTLACAGDCLLDTSGCTDSWNQEAYLKAANPDTDDRFGWSVAISADTVVVAAVAESSNQTTITNGAAASADNSALNAGAAYVYTRSGTTWTQQAYLKAANADADDSFGWSVAISGDTIVVSAYGEDSNQTTITNGTGASSDDSALGAGAAYVFTRTGNDWTEQAYLKAANAQAADSFGASVAISADTIVVGASYEDSNQTTVTNGTGASADDSTGSAGSAYVYTRTGTTWTQQAYLKAANAGGGDTFGSLVAISGDTIVVGAVYEDSNQTTVTNAAGASADDSASSAGAAYVYSRVGTIWTEEAYLKAANAEANDYFGISVAISGDTIVVGAVNEDSNQTTVTNGVGASADDSALNAGAVYVYTRSGTMWTEQAYLKAANALVADDFGISVAISGDTVAVGAFREDSNQTTVTNGTGASADNSADHAGAAYLYTRTGTTWTEQAYLKASNAEATDYFGFSVAISGGTVVVGAWGEASNQATITNGVGASSDNSAPSAGAAYVFEL